jgi:transcriptional regulator with XRE-family HTH domain
MQLPRTRKAPNPVDQHVGSRVRMRRMMLAMSQQALGAALGLTFQQVQKYEKGSNRIGASRLQQISHILQVPVAFFFEGMASTPTTAAAPNASAPYGSHGSALSMAQIDDFVSNSDGLRLMGAFMRIDNAALRRRIAMLVQEIAGDDGN